MGWDLTGIAVIVLAGLIVLATAWRLDVRRRDRARGGLREIPGVNPKQRPSFVTEDDLDALPIDQSPIPDENALATHREAAATLPAGAASGAFLNRAHDGLAVLLEPLVLTLDADLTAERDVTTILIEVSRRASRLVLVAPYFSATALATLRANCVAGRLRILPVPLDDALARRRAVALSGGRLVPQDALAAGWLPDETWGRCFGWVSDLDDSWIFTHRPGADLTQSLN